MHKNKHTNEIITTAIYSSLWTYKSWAFGAASTFNKKASPRTAIRLKLTFWIIMAADVHQLHQPY
jgi:hypothetical protein